MRSVRLRLLVSHLILVLLLGIVMSAAISSFAALGRGIDRVLEGNYKSIVAAHSMQNGIQLDFAGYGLLFAKHRTEAIDRFRRGHLSFTEGISLARQSVNEEGEAQIIDRIERAGKLHREAVNLTLTASTPSYEAFAQDESQNRSELRKAINDLIRTNQDAMNRESEMAKALVQSAAWRSIGIAGTALLLAIFMTVALSRSILRPLRILAERAEAIGGGDYDQRVPIRGKDEFGKLAKAFNAMSARLREIRKHEQSKLARAQLMSSQALESLYDPVIVSDAQGMIVYLNTAAEGLFGPSPAAPRTPIVEHIGDERILVAMKKALSQEVVVATEDESSLIPISVEGKDRTYRLRATPIKDEEGVLLGSVTVLEDITHLKELDQMKSEFIGVASHELRTPVTSLAMSVQLFEEVSENLTSAQQEIIRVQKNDLERLQNVIKELLDLSRLESGRQPMRFANVGVKDLLASVEESVAASARDSDVRLDTQLDPNLQHVEADRGQIERVLINLSSNAIRHSPKGTTVRIQAVDQGDQVTFSVEDQGEGIPESYLNSIFDHFVQVPGATGGGAGLGLSISQHIVNAHGGKIWADSELGKGSKFSFSIPKIQTSLRD